MNGGWGQLEVEKEIQFVFDITEKICFNFYADMKLGAKYYKL